MIWGDSAQPDDGAWRAFYIRASLRHRPTKFTLTLCPVPARLISHPTARLLAVPHLTSLYSHRRNLHVGGLSGGLSSRCLHGRPVRRNYEDKNSNNPR